MVAEHPLCVRIAVCGRFLCRVVVVAVGVEVLTVQANPLSLSTVPFSFGKDPGESHDVAQSHLKGLVLGQLLILTPLWNDLSQAIEDCVQSLHPSPLAGIGSQSSLGSVLHPFRTALHNTACSTSALRV